MVTRNNRYESNNGRVYRPRVVDVARNSIGRVVNVGQTKRAAK